MDSRITRAAGLVCSAAYAAFIVWIYASQPRTVAQVTGGMASALGAYRIDQAAFDEGLRLFREDRFSEARAAFARADPAQQDAKTGFYIAYSYYREGWGRLYHDDVLYRKGLDALERAVAVTSDGVIVVDDENLGLRTAEDLRNELARGTTKELEDFNPLRVVRKRL
jgi:hypothetical protein